MRVCKHIIQLNRISGIRRGMGLLLILCFMLGACNPFSSQSATPPSPQLASEITFYSWTEDYLIEVVEEFSKEYGVKVNYLTYESQELAVEELRAGKSYDLVVMENQFIPGLIAEGLLAKLDHRNLPNFKNISPNFRNLTHDPDNSYSIPYSWGNTGLVVRSDLIEKPILRWADLWDESLVGKILLWENVPRYTMGIALMVLGHSINSEDPQELRAAMQSLLEIKSRATWVGENVETSAPWLIDGSTSVAMGWALDYWEAQKESERIEYVLPQEGTILWGDNFVIPANSPNKYTTELLLNFILKPEISGELVNLNYYAMPNDLADPFILPEILSDPVIYTPQEALGNAEILLALSPSGEKIFNEIWAEFLEANP